jgi:hypothetical protein
VVTVDQHGVVDGLDQALKHLFAAGKTRRAQLEVLEQVVHRRTELFERLGSAFEADARRCPGFCGEAPDLLGEIRDRTLLPPLPNDEQEHAGGQEGC